MALFGGSSIVYYVGYVGIGSVYVYVVVTCDSEESCVYVWALFGSSDEPVVVTS